MRVLSWFILSFQIALIVFAKIVTTKFNMI